MSPDGTQIAYTGYTDLPDGGERGFTTDIYVMNADRSNPRQLTTTGYDTHAAWSPDGQQLVFESVRDKRSSGGLSYASDLYTMNADGSNQNRIVTCGDEDCANPVWVTIPEE